ncbi:hypothetical protein HRM2_26450 [Desulforapulum autotrophicum HRM2]|uniref:Uncharacterized protein n=1 Tax=Desulforapulum autotrophicum (strain ATCC 43914 / DSM 3382 / VKM B-1955 / HRM2) TaxID=177437 RepID=C0QI03_DESAH|nr:hypothetical protein HRM2_26450 [Desulforapulum autotrophicum HRM2]
MAVAMVDAAQSKFPNLKGCSFDKGFYSPENKKALKDNFTLLVLPKKGSETKLNLKKKQPRSSGDPRENTRQLSPPSTD